MPKLDCFTRATPAWDATSAPVDQGEAIGGFQSAVDAEWVIAARDASAAVVALYEAVAAIEARLIAKKLPLAGQRNALLAALKALR